MNTKVIYHQMLVSPHIGGGAKMAMEIHRYAAAERGPVSRLLLPRRGEAEIAAINGGMPFLRYNLNRLASSNRLHSYFENLLLLIRTVGACPKGLVHVHSPFVYGAARPFFIFSRFKTVLHIQLDFNSVAFQKFNCADSCLLPLMRCNIGNHHQ